MAVSSDDGSIMESDHVMYLSALNMHTE